MTASLRNSPNDFNNLRTVLGTTKKKLTQNRPYLTQNRGVCHRKNGLSNWNHWIPVLNIVLTYKNKFNLRNKKEKIYKEKVYKRIQFFEKCRFCHRFSATTYYHYICFFWRCHLFVKLLFIFQNSLISLTNSVTKSVTDFYP